MIPEVLPPVEIPAEKLPPPPAPALSARFKPLLLRVIDPLTLVPENVVPVPANLVVWALGNAAEVMAVVALVCWNSDELLVAMNEPDAAEPRKFDELATGMIDDESDVAMNEPDAAVPRKFVELATGMMDEELLSAT